MKKLFSGALLVCLAVLLCSCIPKKRASSNRLKVVASSPVVYDFARNLIDESLDETIYLSLTVKNGYAHEYVPGEAEKQLIAGADLFIYVGGSSEQWAEEIAPANSLRLMDFSTTDDEHFILLPQYAIECTDKICEALCRLDSANTAVYQKNCQNYLTQLKLLQSGFELASQKVQTKPVIICDRFPFRLLFEQFGIDYVTAYDCCPAPKDISKDFLKQTAIDFGKLIDETASGAIYTMDNSDGKLAKSVINNSKNPHCSILVLDSMETTTLSQLFTGKNYIDTMRGNLSQLSQAFEDASES